MGYHVCSFTSKRHNFPPGVHRPITFQFVTQPESVEMINNLSDYLCSSNLHHSRHVNGVNRPVPHNSSNLVTVWWPHRSHRTALGTGCALLLIQAGEVNPGSPIFDKIISLPSSLKSRKQMWYMLSLKHKSHLDIRFQSKFSGAVSSFLTPVHQAVWAVSWGRRQENTSWYLMVGEKMSCRVLFLPPPPSATRGNDDPIIHSWWRLQGLKASYVVLQM